MKMFAYLLPLVALNAVAANVQITINLEGMNVGQIKETYATFKSTNPLCSKPQISGLGLPVLSEKKVIVPAKLRGLNDSTALVEFSSDYTGNDFCAFKLWATAVTFKNNVNWISFTSTTGNDFANSQSKLDLFKNPNTRFEANCKKTRCKRSANGVNQDPSTSNLMEFYMDGKALKNNSSLQSEITVRFTE